MPRYHFNVYDRLGRAEDSEGRELSGQEMAREVAVNGARSLIAADVIEGRLDLIGRIEVTDEAGIVLFVVPYAEAVWEAPAAGDPDAA